MFGRGGMPTIGQSDRQHRGTSLGLPRKQGSRERDVDPEAVHLAVGDLEMATVDESKTTAGLGRLHFPKHTSVRIDDHNLSRDVEDALRIMDGDQKGAVETEGLKIAAN